MTANKSVTAYFTAITYTLTTATSGSGSVTASPSAASYASGTQVSLTATPAAGYQFDHWAGDASGTSSPVTVTMTANKSVTAYFTALAAATHFPRPAAQPSWVDFQGALRVCGAAAEPGDEVAVFDPQGVLCGQFTLTMAGYYGWLHVYADDSATPQDEGAEPGDALTFGLWDASQQQELLLHPVPVPGQGGPQWTQNGDRFGADLEAYCSQTIPLQRGWNLVSFATDTCYYATPAPPLAPMPEGVRLAPVASVADALASIAGKYDVVRSFDQEGAHTFDPDVPSYVNDLTYLAPGYGYWIRASEACTLTMPGNCLDPGAKLALRAGWNLVGCWADRVRWCGRQPAVAFAQTGAAPLQEEVAAKAGLWPGLAAGSFDVVRSFDIDGAHTYAPRLPDYINDLYYVGPGYGYWVKMKTDGTLGF